MSSLNKIAVIGSSGQLTSCLKLITGSNWRFYGRPDFDITNENQCRTIIQQFTPSKIVNCAAYTDVDGAEDEPAKAHAVNGQGPKNLAIVARELGIPLLHISTDYVFDGQKQVPYTEEDPTNPLSIYGKSKLEGEKNIRQIWDKHIIIRSSWIYSEFGSNFLKTMLSLASKRNEIGVVNDQIGCPTSAHNLAALVKRVMEENSIPFGIYHYSDNKPMSWYEFAKMIFLTNENLTGAPQPKLKEISTNQLNLQALRPAYSVLNQRKLMRYVDKKENGFEESVSDVIKRINTEIGDDL